MVKLVADVEKMVKVRHSIFHNPHKIYQLFGDVRENIREGEKIQSCINFSLLFCENDEDENFDIYHISLTYEELQNFIDWGRLCIYTNKPISVKIGRRVFHEVEYGGDDVEEDIEDVDNFVELQKRKITYYPLNKDKGYLEMQKIPLNLIRKHYDIEKNMEDRTYKKVLVDKKQMIQGIFRNVLLNILGNMSACYYNSGCYHYLVDTIKDDLGLSQEETLDYINSLDESGLRSLVYNKYLGDILLYGREPEKLKKLVKEKFLQENISYSDYVKKLRNIHISRNIPIIIQPD